MKRTAALCAVLALAACGQPEPVLILPPAELATCADEPAAPDLVEWAWAQKVEAAAVASTPREAAETAIELARFTALKRDEMMLEAYLMLRSALGDCKAKVDGLAAWRKAAGT